MTLTLSAQDLFRTAYENRYTWDTAFPGYRADLTLSQGDEVYQGQVQVNSDFTVTVTGIEESAVKESVLHQLRDVVTHRKRNDFEQVHGKNQFSFGDRGSDDSQAILVTGDAMGSHYRVRGEEICQVSRVMGPMAFTIDTQKTFSTGQGYIAVEYQAIFRDAQTRELKAQRQFQESYTNVGGYYLPEQQVIMAIAPDGQQTTTIFQFSHFQLLTP